MKQQGLGKKLMTRLSTVQMIVLLYLGTVTISTLLLSIPIAHKPGVKLSFIDALFTAVSAISVTGLTVVSTPDTFNTLGLIILMFIFQLGGIGIMTLGTFAWLLIGKKIGLKERQMIMVDQNRSTLSGLVKLMKDILILIIAIEVVGGLILSFYFMTFFPSWKEAFLHGMFKSVSATTNAGFDITGSSLIPYKDDYFVQTINIILLILGAIGFPVLIEIKEFIQSRRKKAGYTFSLFTHITTFTYFALVIAGVAAILVFEFNHFLKGKSWHESLFYSLFQSVSARSGGLATLDMNEFSAPTLLFLSFLMFVGASPSSVGGGIRTTTLAIALLSIYFYAKGKNSIKVFKREIDPEDVLKSYMVIFTAFMICGFSVMLLTFFEPKATLTEIIFEVCSAFGTTGLSMGMTANLSVGGKLVLIVAMFIGRIGIFSFLFLMRGKTTKENFHYPKEKVIIG